MSPKASTPIATDFSEVFGYLTTSPLIPTSPQAQVTALAKRVHECTYSLVLWKFRLSELTDHAKPFIEEIASDALQIMPQVLLGYTRATKLLVRGIVENTLRFIYFMDHPIEFILMNQEKKWYLSVENLFDYIKAHPNFRLTEDKFDAINRLKSLYSELSSGLHGRTVRDLEMRTALVKISYDHVKATEDAIQIKKCTEAVNFVLAIANQKEMRRFTTDDRRLILRTLPKNARAFWHEFEPVI